MEVVGLNEPVNNTSVFETFPAPVRGAALSWPFFPFCVTGRGSGGGLVVDVLIDDEGQCLLSCCRERHYQPVPKFQRTSTPRQQLSKLERRIQFCLHSVPCEEIGELCRRETEVLP